MNEKPIADLDQRFHANQDVTSLAHAKLWPDYVGSPMLPALSCASAGMAGEQDLALILFEENFGAYDQPPASPMPLISA